MSSFSPILASGTFLDYLTVVFLLGLVMAYLLHLVGLLVSISPLLDATIDYAATIGTEPAVSSSFLPRDRLLHSDSRPLPHPALLHHSMADGAATDHIRVSPFGEKRQWCWERPDYIPKRSRVPRPEFSAEECAAAVAWCLSRPTLRQQRLLRQKEARAGRGAKHVRFAENKKIIPPSPPTVIDLTDSAPLKRLSAMLNEHDEIWFFAPGASTRSCRCATCVAAAINLARENAQLVAAQSVVFPPPVVQSNIERLAQEFDSVAATATAPVASSPPQQQETAGPPPPPPAVTLPAVVPPPAPAPVVLSPQIADAATTPPAWTSSSSTAAGERANPFLSVSSDDEALAAVDDLFGQVLQWQRQVEAALATITDAAAKSAIWWQYATDDVCRKHRANVLWIVGWACKEGVLNSKKLPPTVRATKGLRGAKMKKLVRFLRLGGENVGGEGIVKLIEAAEHAEAQFA